MKRAIYIMFRGLSVLVGLAFLITSPLVLWEERTVGAAMFLITSMAMGMVFLRYGVTGQARSPKLPPQLRVPARILIGLALIAYGIYLLVKEQWSAFGIFACVVFVFFGASSIWLAYELRKRARTA